MSESKKRRYIIEKDFEHAGLRCVIVGLPMGHRCGYVGVPSSHKLFGLGYDTPELEFVSVHGGLTYSNEENYPLENTGLWWFGFDCAHYGDGKDKSLMDDKTKEMYANPIFDSEFLTPFRTTEYVQGECVALAEQLAGVA